jgi:hypothetical protein
MSSNIDALKILIGKKIVSAATEVSQVVPINGLDLKGLDLLEIPLNIVFIDYTLFIYNKWTLINAPIKSIESLLGIMVNTITEARQILEFHFDNDSVLQIDLSDNGYVGPEAMSLHGPNHLLIVWN